MQNAVDSARAEGADYVVLLAHLGIMEECMPYTSSEVIANTTGIDVVLDGHSHSVIECDRVKNADGNWTLLSSTGYHLEHIGMLLITRDGNITTGLVTDYAEKDAATEALVQDLLDDLAETLQQVVAHTDYPPVISDPATGELMVRTAETNLGNLCADAYRSVTGADIAFINGGGVRHDIAAGDITYGDLLRVHPFSNAICMVEATGQEILDALELGVSAWPEMSGGFLQVSGLTYELDLSVPSSVGRMKTACLWRWMAPTGCMT